MPWFSGSSAVFNSPKKRLDIKSCGLCNSYREPFRDVCADHEGSWCSSLPGRPRTRGRELEASARVQPFDLFLPPDLGSVHRCLGKRWRPLANARSGSGAGLNKDGTGAARSAATKRSNVPRQRYGGGRALSVQLLRTDLRSVRLANNADRTFATQ